MNTCRRRVTVLLFAPAALAATPACEGDSTPAAGHCIVAFQDFNRAVAEDARSANVESALDVETSLERTIYSCDDVDQWLDGFERVYPELVESSGVSADFEGEVPLSPEDATLFLRDFALCDGAERSRTPVCRDARARGLLDEDAPGGFLENID